MPIKLPETPEEVSLPDFQVNKSPRTRRIKVVSVLGFVSLAVIGCVFTNILTGQKASSSTNWPVPSDISLESCDTWTKHPGWFWQRSSAETTFSIPIDLNNLLILSRGTKIGRFRVIGEHDGDDIQVDVRATYPHGIVLEESIRVCKINRGDGEHGLGLFTEGSRTMLPDIDFVADIRLPLSLNNTLRLPKLETDLLTQPDVWLSLPTDKVEFDEVILRSNSGHVRALGSIRTKRAQLEVTDHYVAGSLQVLSNYTHEYHLKNGPIEYADAKVYVEPSSKEPSFDDHGHGPNKTFAHTIRLASGSSHKLARLQGNTNGPFTFEVSSPELLLLDLAYDFPSPYYYPFTCYPRSFNIPCKELDITPPVTFVGGFNLTSVLVPAEVRMDGLPDPMGIGRKRNIKLEGIGSEKTTGVVGWEDNKFNDGFDTIEFNLITSLMPSLRLR